jgi:hypothetical protein
VAGLFVALLKWRLTSIKRKAIDMFDFWMISIVMALALTVYCLWYGLIPKPTYSAAWMGMFLGFCFGGIFHSSGPNYRLAAMIGGFLVGLAIDRRRKQAAPPSP